MTESLGSLAGGTWNREWADWTVLLPDGCEGRLFWAAPSGRAVPDDLAATMQVTTGDPNTDIANVDLFDLVAALAAPRPIWDLADLTAQLRPGGQLYLEIDRPAAVSRPRHLRRRLERLGYRDVRFFWPVQGFARPEVYVPLGDRRYERYYIQRLMWRGSIARRVLGSMLVVLTRLGLFEAAVPRFVAVARLGDATRSTALPNGGTSPRAWLEAIRTGWPTMMGSAATAPVRIGWIVQIAGPGPDRKFICPTWCDDDPDPRAVLKFARTPRAEARIESEHRALGLLDRYASATAIQVPRPLGRLRLADRAVSAESPVLGRPLTAYIDQRPRSVEDMRSRWTPWVEWLADLHARSSRPATPAELDDLLFDPMKAVAAELTLGRGEAKMIQRMRNSATHLVERHGLLVGIAHNDLGPTNVFVSDEGRPVAIIDWESAGFGLPSTDLFYFLARFSDAVASRMGPVPGWDYHSVFLTDRVPTPTAAGPPARLAQEWVELYRSRVELSPQWLPILFVAGWIMHARNEHRKLADADPGSQDQGTPFRRRLEESLTAIDGSWLSRYAGRESKDR